MNLTVDPLNKKALLRMSTITKNFLKSLDVVLPFLFWFSKFFMGLVYLIARLIRQ